MKPVIYLFARFLLLISVAALPMMQSMASVTTVASPVSSMGAEHCHQTGQASVVAKQMVLASDISDPCCCENDCSCPGLDSCTVHTTSPVLALPAGVILYSSNHSNHFSTVLENRIYSILLPPESPPPIE